MVQTCLRFYEELNDHLAPERRKTAFVYPFSGATVRELLAELGVPRDAVELILVNGESVGFACPVRDGDRISVYPMFESLDVAPILRVRPQPLRRPRFLIVERELRRLSGYLRLCGFDVREAGSRQGAGQREVGTRILLSRGTWRDRDVLRFLQLRERLPQRQLAEVLSRLDLWSAVRPLRRCLRCNAALRRPEVDGAVGGHRTARPNSVVCPKCRREYRVGRHERWIRSLMRQVTDRTP